MSRPLSLVSLSGLNGDPSKFDGKPRETTHKQVLMCQICISFMADWLSLPLSVNEPAYIKWTAVKRHAVELATLFHVTLSRLKESDRLIIHSEFDLYSISDDTHAGTQLLQLIESVPNELPGLIAFIEDHCAIRASTNRLWLGIWLLRFWTTVFKLHKEHTDLIDVDECRSPPGLSVKPSTFRNTFMDSMAVSWVSYAEYYGLYD